MDKLYIKAILSNGDKQTEKVLYALDKDRYALGDVEKLLENVMLSESLFGDIIEAWITEDIDEPQSKAQESGRVCLEC